MASGGGLIQHLVDFGHSVFCTHKMSILPFNQADSRRPRTNFWPNVESFVWKWREERFDFERLKMQKINFCGTQIFVFSICVSSPCRWCVLFCFICFTQTTSSQCYKTFFGGILENLDFSLSWKSKKRPF